jgi:type IV secretory pathway TrbL component
MTTILLLVVYYPSRFRKNDYFRLAADAVLFMGFLSLLIKV